ncbi:MAG TPA: class I SAM-dependent methyltransferase [Polyangiaceae bacterium]|jgi:SAM-dependent methyltransferase
MTLPEVEPCLALGAEGWGALGRRLRAIGLTSQAYEPFQKLAWNAHRSLRSPIVKWHLRRDPAPRAVVMRMLAFWDPVTLDEARAALGDAVTPERLVELGVLGRTAGGGVVSRFVLRLVDDRFVLSDDVNVGGEAVMGVGPTTEGLIAAARPRHRARRALDLGCGAGTVAVALAATCDEVVATDISTRAVALTRINAWLNGIGNVEARAGDLFAPVAGETFDLVVSQPPFVARDDASPSTTFLFGGARGDELVTALLGKLGPHLSPGGTAVLLVEWPIVEGDAPLEQRVRAALGGSSGDLSVMVVQWTDVDVDDHCARYPMIGHVWQDEAFERDAIRRREHFEKTRIRALRPTFTVVRRTSPGAGWTATVLGRWPGSGAGVRGQLERLIAARDLVAQGDDALRAASLRAGEGVVFSPPAADGKVDVTLPAERLQPSLTSNEESVRLMRFVEGAPRVDEGIARCMESEGGSAQDAEAAADAADALEAVKEALLLGVLEVREDPTFLGG